MLKPSDYAVIRNLRDRNILENVERHLVSGGGRNIIVTCADGHQVPDVVVRHKEFIETGAECCCHSLCLNGGALLLSRSFTQRPRNPIGKLLLNQIEEAACLKGITTVGLYIHAPCGAAGKRNLTFEETLSCLFEAKETVKRNLGKKIQGLQVACFCQIDYDDGQKRTYFIARRNYAKWQELK